MATIKLPTYLKWREGRPRWEPGPKLRQGGWRGRDLKREDGAWLPLGEAIAAAEALNNDVAAWRAGGAKRAPRRPTPASPKSVHARYKTRPQSPRFQRLAASTERDYRSKAQVFLAEFGDKSVCAIEPHHLYAWWEELYAARGHAMANGTLAVARSLLSHARRVGWRADNPARQLGLETVAPRVVIWRPAEVAAFCAAGDELVPQVVDAVIAGLYTGQRRGDVLALEDRGNGRCQLRQSKRGALVSIPMMDQLVARLAVIRKRRAAKCAAQGTVVSDLAIERRIVLRADGQPYDADSFARDFAKVRAAAAKTLPSIAGLRFQDLRDTAITRLALAGCSIVQIRAITGHDLETIHSVLKHYIALDDRMADSAIAQLKTWMIDEGIAL